MPPGSKKRKAARRKMEIQNSATDDGNNNHDPQPDSPSNPTNEETVGGGTSEEHERKEGYQSSSDHPATAGDTDDDDPPNSESISSMENPVNGSTTDYGRNHVEISPEAEELSRIDVPVVIMDVTAENGNRDSRTSRDVTGKEPLPDEQDVRVEYVDEGSKDRKGSDYKETLDSSVENGKSDSVTSRDVMEEEPLPEAQDVRMEYVDESSKGYKGNDLREQPLPMLVGPTDFVAGQSVPVNEEMAQAAEAQAVSTETLSTESGIMAVPLHEDEPHDIPETAEDAHDPLAPRRTWWNCCGLLEVFTGSRS